MTWSQGQKDNFDKWLEWFRDTPLVHECGECGKVALLKAYHDGRKQFLGKVCSDKCAEQLPGQGASADYEPDHREDDDD